VSTIRAVFLNIEYDIMYVLFILFNQCFRVLTSAISTTIFAQWTCSLSLYIQLFCRRARVFFYAICIYLRIVVSSTIYISNLVLVSLYSTTKGVTSRPGSAYSSAHPCFCEVLLLNLYFSAMFCRSLSVLLFFFDSHCIVNLLSVLLFFTDSHCIVNLLSVLFFTDSHCIVNLLSVLRVTSYDYYYGIFRLFLFMLIVNKS
jgi:hypothetical protein